jgi:ATP-dependent DNA ligase
MSILLPDDEFYPHEFMDLMFADKEAESAKGIPDRRYYGDLRDIKPGTLVEYILQRHLAERAGPHFDVRMGDQKGLFSWATRKPLPGPGGRTLLIQQPMHSYKYKDFEGTIPAGKYGAGRVQKQDEGQILVTDISPTAIHFTMAHKRYPERFVMVRPQNWKDKDWLLINKTPTQGLPYEKVRYKKIPAEDVDNYINQMKGGDTVEAKIDGASSLIKLLKDGVEVVSYRQSKETGRPIVYTEKMLGGLPKMNIPPELVGTVLKGEMYGVKEKEDYQHGAIPPQELGGILNSSLAKAIKDQQSRKIQLKNMVYDIQQLGSKHVDWHKTPRLDRRKMIEQVLQHLPQDKFHISQAATTQDEARQLWGDIRGGKHPLTTEGVVAWPQSGPPLKSKIVEDSDVHITGTFPGEGRLSNAGIGGFTYALEPGGATVGRVGTGLSDELRRSAYAGGSDAYIGRVARIRSQNQLPSGAYRAPALIALHEDYPQAKAANTIEQPGNLPKAWLITGNPYYTEGAQKAQADKFYSGVQSYLESQGYEVGRHRGDPYTSPDAGDLWVGHSRGTDRLRFAPPGTRTVSLDAYEDENDYRQQLQHLLQQRGLTRLSDLPVEDRPLPPAQHYTFNKAMQKALTKSASVLVEPYMGVSLAELAELGICLAKEGSTVCEELLEELVDIQKDASFLGKGFQQEPIGWQSTRSPVQNILDYLYRVHGRGKRLVSQAYNTRDWQAHLSPNPRQAGLNNMMNDLNKVNPIITDPVDRFLYG